jgi:hypothetical protein
MKCGENLQMQQSSLTKTNSIYQTSTALPAFRIELNHFRNKFPHKHNNGVNISKENESMYSVTLVSSLFAGTEGGKCCYQPQWVM